MFWQIVKWTKFELVLDKSVPSPHYLPTVLWFLRCESTYLMKISLYRRSQVKATYLYTEKGKRVHKNKNTSVHPFNNITGTSMAQVYQIIWKPFTRY